MECEKVPRRNRRARRSNSVYNEELLDISEDERIESRPNTANPGIKTEKLEHFDFNSSGSISQGISDDKDSIKSLLSEKKTVWTVQNKVTLSPHVGSSCADSLPGIGDIKQEWDSKTEEVDICVQQFKCDIDDKNFLANLVCEGADTECRPSSTPIVGAPIMESIQKQSFKYKKLSKERNLNAKLSKSNKISSKLKKFTCNLCEFSTIYKSHFKNHITAVHFQVKKFKCTNCETRFSTKFNRQRHIDQFHHKIKNFNCHICKFTCINKRFLLDHIRSSHRTVKGKKCDKNYAKMKSKRDMTSFKKEIKHYKYKRRASRSTKRSGSRSSVNYNSEDFQCALCPFKTTGKIYLQRHIDNKHLHVKNYMCKWCDYKTGRNAYLQRHIYTVHYDVRNYKCELCSYSAYQESYLKLHVDSVHLKLRNFKCDLCSYAGFRKFNLVLHKRRVHKKRGRRGRGNAASEEGEDEDEQVNPSEKLLEEAVESCKVTESENKDNVKVRTIMCKWCDYSSTYKGHIRNHISSVHFQVKRFKCDQCDAGFVVKGNLQRHIGSVHLKIKNFKCEFCDFVASEKSTVLTHSKARHIKPEEVVIEEESKIFQCDLCTYSSKQKVYLQRHVSNIHLAVKNHKCDLCEYITTRNAYLQRHVKSVHHNMKNFKCELCPYAAYHECGLKRHIKSVHLKIRDFKCEFCTYAGFRMADLRLHVSRVHKYLNREEAGVGVSEVGCVEENIVDTTCSS